MYSRIEKILDVTRKTLERRRDSGEYNPDWKIFVYIHGARVDYFRGKYEEREDSHRFEVCPASWILDDPDVSGIDAAQLFRETLAETRIAQADAARLSESYFFPSWYSVRVLNDDGETVVYPEIEQAQFEIETQERAEA